ncbi:MAG: hypothetical protein ACOC5T_07210 [Elusimicrobiota bacterium]
MKVEPDFVFKEGSLLKALEEIRKSSFESNLFTKSKIFLSLYPDRFNSDYNIEIKPYGEPEDLDPIKDYKYNFSIIELILPFKQKVTKRLEKIYEKDKFYTKDRGFLELTWSNLSKNNKSNYYSFSMVGRSLCDNRGEQFEKAINDPKTYESFRCSNKICPGEINSFCKEFTSTLNKYSYPKNVKFKK